MINKKVINRLFNFLIILFFATPFLFIFFEWFIEDTQNGGLQELLQNNPHFNIAFIISFVVPFIGLYLIQLKKDFAQKKEIEDMIVKLFIIMISFFIMGNSTHATGVAALTIIIFLFNKMSIKEMFHYLKKNSIQLKAYIAPFILLIVSILVRYVTVLIT